MSCFQHPDREAEVTISFYDGGKLVEFGMCHNCRHATAIACLQYEKLISPDYEIIEIEE
jgi:hypothetical protein